MDDPLKQQAWRRSARCASGACVEIEARPDTVAVRSSQAPDTVVSFSRDAFDALLRQLKRG
jgi:uncharacterized protein DUF397